jgi:nickel-dependent lactate racemase
VARAHLTSSSADVVGLGLTTGCLDTSDVESLVGEGLSRLDLDGRRALVIIPDGTRTMPMPLAFGAIERALGSRVRALDYLVALGTHVPMSDAALSRHIGRPVVDGRAGRSRIINHRWDDPSAFVTLGTIPADEISSLSGGRLAVDIPVALNKLVLDYDHVIICGPVFPHEVAGYSGGAKYLFPGIAAPSIIHTSHWLGALVTNYDTIGTIDTPVRAVINRAASLVPTPLSLIALVVTEQGVAGTFVGPLDRAWRPAALLSANRHVVWLDTPIDRMLAVMPAMYQDIWTAAKGAYKAEPAIADGGEVVIYAPHVKDVSVVHGRVLEEIGYHCKAYFTEQWDRFKQYPGGILAHSTHVKGLGTYDRASGIERSRIRVTLATGISAERCSAINLGYRDPDSIDIETWAAEEPGRSLVVRRAGEMLYRVGKAQTR